VAVISEHGVQFCTENTTGFTEICFPSQVIDTFDRDVDETLRCATDTSGLQSETRRDRDRSRPS